MVSAGLIPSEDGEGESFMPPSLEGASSLQYSWACRSITLISAFIFTWQSACVSMTSYPLSIRILVTLH